MDEKKIIRQISTVGIAGNVALVAFKMYAGIAGRVRHADCVYRRAAVSEGGG